MQNKSQQLSVVTGFLVFVCYGVPSGFTGQEEKWTSQNNATSPDIYCGLEENQTQILKLLRCLYPQHLQKRV